MGIDQYYCPVWYNLTVGGVYFSPEYDYIEVKVAKCSGKSYCKTPTQIDAAILGQVNIAFVAKYFDTGSYN